MTTASVYEYIVRTKDLHKIYTMGGQEVRALDGVDVDIRRGEYISIMGPSGSGKSTLFNMIGGLDKPTSGHGLHRRGRHGPARRLRAGLAALPQDRLHLPDLQPHPGHDRAGERDPADDLRRHDHR